MDGYTFPSAEPAVEPVRVSRSLGAYLQGWVVRVGVENENRQRYAKGVPEWSKHVPQTNQKAHEAGSFVKSARAYSLTVRFSLCTRTERLCPALEYRVGQGRQKLERHSPLTFGQYCRFAHGPHGPPSEDDFPVHASRRPSCMECRLTTAPLTCTDQWMLRPPSSLQCCPNGYPIAAGVVDKAGLYSGHGERTVDAGVSSTPPMESMLSPVPQLMRSSSPSPPPGDGDGCRSRWSALSPRHSTSSSEPSLCCSGCGGSASPRLRWSLPHGEKMS